MKTKTLNDLDWLKLAVSKDDACPNLKGIYQNGKDLVSTDGDRLHIVTLENQGDKKGFIDPTMADLQFPDYKQVIPLNNSYNTSLSNIGGEIAAFLTHVIAVNKMLFSKYYRDNVVMIDFHNETISYDYNQGDMSLKGNIKITLSKSFPLCIAIKANYLLDALKAGTCFNIAVNNAVSPVLIKADNRQAVIMPIRSEVVKARQTEIDKSLIAVVNQAIA